jgi:hypothetical protein
MSSAASGEAHIEDVSITDDMITARLADGRMISVPLAWSWRLSEATPEQRSRFEIIGNGSGVRWPDIDEDISAEGMLHGVPARRPAK